MLYYLRWNETATYYFVCAESNASDKCFLSQLKSHQWWSGSTHKTDRQEVSGTILDRACRPTCSEFSMVSLKLAEIRYRIP